MPESEWQDSKDRGDNKERQSMFERALEFAMKAHRGQVRKGSSVPYIVHPIETALIVMTLSDDQDVIIAALFHDVRFFLLERGYGAFQYYFIVFYPVFGPAYQGFWDAVHKCNLKCERTAGLPYEQFVHRPQGFLVEQH